MPCVAVTVWMPEAVCFLESQIKSLHTDCMSIMIFNVNIYRNWKKNRILKIRWNKYNIIQFPQCLSEEISMEYFSLSGLTALILSPQQLPHMLFISTLHIYIYMYAYICIHIYYAHYFLSELLFQWSHYFTFTFLTSSSKCSLFHIFWNIISITM